MCFYTPVTVGIKIDNSIHERQQLPLTLAWASTIHKSKGMTSDYAWVDVGKKGINNWDDICCPKQSS